jgi:hypothetical protein
VRRRCDPGTENDVEAEIALLAKRRLTRMQAHPHLDLDVVGPGLRGEPPLRRERAGHGVTRARERKQEPVSVGVDLASARLGSRLPHDAPVPCDERAVVVAEPLQQAGRALDVGEQEGDGAVREAHPPYRGKRDLVALQTGVRSCIATRSFPSRLARATKL